MNWTSFDQFLHMGGYGFYVWGSLCACALTMAGEVALLGQRQRHVIQRLRQLALAEQLDQKETT